MLLGIATLLGACGTAPVATPLMAVPPGTGSQQTSTLWADNTHGQYLMIKKVGGAKTFGLSDRNPPYSVTIMPGHHVLSVSVIDTTTPDPRTSKFVDMEVPVDVVAGRNYVLRILSDGRNVSVRPEDIGSLVCRYEVIGGQQRGFLPVRMACE